MFRVPARLNRHLPRFRLVRIHHREGTVRSIQRMHEYRHIIRHPRPAMERVKESKPAVENGTPVPWVDTAKHQLDQ